MNMATKLNAKAAAPAQKKNPRIGSDFDDFLQEQGQLEESTALTSRAVVRRLLDQNETSVTLATISRAATALGRNMQIALAR
jgi:antitoxin HicB